MVIIMRNWSVVLAVAAVLSAAATADGGSPGGGGGGGGARDELYKNRSSRKIDSRRLFSIE